MVAWVPHILGQQVTARYFPEKQHYLVGEPISVVFEIVNNSSRAVEITGSNCRYFRSNEFEVDGASPKRPIELYGCAEKIIAGSCLQSVRKIQPHSRFRDRLLLEGAFELNSPRTHHIRAKHATRVDKRGADDGVDLSGASEFDVDLRAPKPGELETAYQPFFEGLTSRDPLVQHLAASAVVQNPPSFAETVILKFADDLSVSSLLAHDAVDGLQRLATPAARRKLLEMASTTASEFVRQPAIEALGKIGNPEDCEAMLAIAGASKNYTQSLTYIVAGRICKERALLPLTSLVGAGDSQLLVGVTGGLVNTSSRNAVPPLITLLQNPDPGTRRNAEAGLATLTHRKSGYGIEEEAAANQSHTEWLKWWSVNATTAPLYGSDQCMATQPLF